MRIIYDAYGQMCNRLWEYIDQVAWGMKYGKKVISLFWDPSLKDFHNLRNNPYIKFPLYIHALQGGKWGDLYARILFKLLHNNHIQHLFASSFFKRMGFISGEQILFSDNYYPEMWPQEKVFFSPNSQIVEKIDAAFDSYRQGHQHRIVGVHMRKGDYKEYHNGFFYYEDEEYAQFMDQIIAMFGDDTQFFFASNERINKDHFQRFNILDIQSRSAVEDMYSLSKCDLIMGPYSSFSTWASFYGQVPYYCFKRNGQIRRSDFVIIKKMARPTIS